MGKASRRKREARVMPTPAIDKPRWAGADGFDYAWTLNEAYMEAATALHVAGDDYSRAGAAANVLTLKSQMLRRQTATLEALLVARGGELEPKPRATHPAESVLPGDFLALEVDHHKPYARALGVLASEHQQALRSAIPILFDPLAMPEPDTAAADGLRLPFPVVTCDFLTTAGLSMPVTAVRGLDDGEWVGLLSATMRQVGDAIDVWPVVTTLLAREGDERQTPRTLMYGKVRLNGSLPEPPEGLDLLDGEGWSVWTIAMDRDPRSWASLWAVLPAYAAASALRLLEAVNVSLEPVELPRAARRRAARAGAEPALEVVVRTSHRDNAAPLSGTVDWQHRWTVRGHWKHFTKGAIFNANPRKRVQVGGVECVRIWCPPFVKGPEGKPLVLKSRRADHGLGGKE